MAKLEDDIRFLKGIGETRAKALKKLGIVSLRDLLCYFPRAYEDRTKEVPIAELLAGETACVRAMVATEPALRRIRSGMELIKFRAVDDSGSMSISYFNQSHVSRQLKQGDTYIFYGKVSIEGALRSMTNPIFEHVDSRGLSTGRIVPIYRLTSGLTQKLLTFAIRRVLDELSDGPPDALPANVCEEAQLCRAQFAYENIHFPSSYGALELSRRRLIFEELFVLSAALSQMKHSRVKKSGVLIKTPNFDEFYASLPFTPTNAQKEAILAAVRDMSSGSVMNRLIQGDVGSGKTLVAAACIWCAGNYGLQSAFMAPTEILVNQHYKTLTELLGPLGLTVAKLTGSMTQKQKGELLSSLKSGETSIVVGTHALIGESVEFNKLSLVITDEQHRFGVNQRAALVSKGEGEGGGNDSPHTLVMSATPIPRTLALMLYGDLDVSIINERPPGRQEVDTFVLGEDMRGRVNQFVQKQVLEGRQVFIVCPAIDESEKEGESGSDKRSQGIKTAKEHALELQNLTFPKLRIGCIHGKLKAAEKDKTMLAFINGEIDVLVSTTVIEVGVDVPNASLIIVENAERFGISQLHQLRGRVGRGGHKSYCVLFTSTLNEDSLLRLKVLEKTNDGFKISEEDLKFRGPGDFFGSRQHGIPEMRIADLCTDLGVLQEAQEAAQALLREDPKLQKPENSRLRSRINELFKISEGTLN